jgi:hypothetical protein
MGIVDKISRTLPSAAKLKILLVTALVLTVPFFVYYLFYIKSQTNYFTNRNFRALDRIGGQTASKVVSLAGVLKNVGENFVRPDESIKPADATDMTHRVSPAPFTPGVKNSEKNLKELGRILENLKDYGAEMKPVKVESATDNKIDGAQSPRSSVTASVGQEDGVTWLYFDARYAAADGSNVVTIQTRTELDKLISPVVGERSVESRKGSDDEDVFDEILITQADGDGRVIFQQGESELRLVSTDKLAPTEGEKAIDLRALGQSSSVADVKLAGGDYKLFLHPVDLSIPQTGAGDGHSLRWIVCGLVPASRFRRDVWAISYSILIIFAFFTGISILSWPILKITLIGPKDRLRTADIYFLFFSTLIGLALLTSLGLYGYSYLTLREELDGQLETLAGNVEDNFQAEVTKSLAQLDALNRNPCVRSDLSRLDGPPSPPSSSPCNTATVSGAGDAANPKRRYRQGILKSRRSAGGKVDPLVPPESSPYPYFDTAVWIDEQGKQRLKWTVEDYQPQFINVPDRLYFSNLKVGHYRFLDNHEFWLDPIVSKTTGRNEVEISVWRKEDGAEAGGTPGAGDTATGRPAARWVSAFDARPLSLMQPVLPEGFGFCVIDESGRVLFHSDEAHHLGENFFEESDDDYSLRSAVGNRREMHLDVNYLGRGHALFVTPLKNFPGWTLITFRDKQLLRTAFLELLTLSSLLFLVYCLVILVCLSIFYLVNLNTNERRAWLWPSSRRTLSYYVSVFVLLILSAVAVIAYVRGGPWSVIVVSLISFAGVCFYFLNLRFGRYGRAWRGLKESGLWGKTYSARKVFYRHDLGYVLNIVILFLLVAIIPAATFFKFAYESEIGLFVKQGQITAAKGLAERDERIRARYVGLWGDGDKESRDKFTEGRLNRDWDIYAGFFFETRPPKPGDALPSCALAQSADDGKPFDPVSWLNNFTPFYNRTSIERLGLKKGAFADGSYEWAETPDTIALRICGDVPNKMQSPWQAMITKVPALGWPGPLWWTAFFLACVPFCLWVNRMVRKIFLLNLHRPTSYPFASLQAGEVSGNLFIILEPPFTQSRTLEGERFQPLSLRDMPDSADWVEAFDYEALRGNDKIVALNHFDYRDAEPEANRRKARFLEEILRRGHRVFIISTTEPWRYCFTDGAGRTEPCEDLDHWTGVISNFFTVYAEDQGEAEDFAEEVERERERLLEEGARVGRHRGDIDDLLATLKEECGPRAPLQRLGLEILRQPKFVNLTREHLINRVRNQAATYYRNLWGSCSSEEKLTLVHLAQDRLLSPSDPEIAQLLRKGLIVRDPDVHLMNESFRQFVKSDECTGDVTGCEEEAKKGSPWHIMKTPLLVALISVVLFLFITQRDLYTSWLAIMTAITTAIPALFKVLSLFQKDPASLSTPQ